MNTEIYDKQKLVEYLLGNLNEAETELFDELNFTDEGFKNALTAAENDLIDAYVRGELTGANLEQFETHYLASPRRREKVKFAATFQEFAEGEKKQEKSVGFFTAFVDFLNANRLSFGFAALILILILSGLWFFAFRRSNPEKDIVIKQTPAPENKQTTPEIPSAVPTQTNLNINQTTNQTPEKTNKNTNLPINRNTPTEKTPLPSPPKITLASFVLTPPLRGNIQTINLQQNAANAAFRLELEADEYKTYRVSLENSAGQNLWQSGVLKSGGNKFLNLGFPAKLLKSGVYSLVVSGTNDGEAEIFANYPFRVVIK